MQYVYSDLHCRCISFVTSPSSREVSFFICHTIHTNSSLTLIRHMNSMAYSYGPSDRCHRGQVRHKTRHLRHYGILRMIKSFAKNYETHVLFLKSPSQYTLVPVKSLLRISLQGFSRRMLQPISICLPAKRIKRISWETAVPLRVHNCFCFATAFANYSWKPNAQLEENKQTNRVEISRVSSGTSAHFVFGISKTALQYVPSMLSIVLRFWLKTTKVKTHRKGSVKAILRWFGLVFLQQGGII